eukprot:Awhi_evm2s1944
MQKHHSHSILSQGHFLSFVTDTPTLYAILVSGKLGKSCVETHLFSLTLSIPCRSRKLELPDEPKIRKPSESARFMGAYFRMAAFKH